MADASPQEQDVGQQPATSETATLEQVAPPLELSTQVEINSALEAAAKDLLAKKDPRFMLATLVRKAADNPDGMTDIAKELQYSVVSDLELPLNLGPKPDGAATSAFLQTHSEILNPTLELQVAAGNVSLQDLGSAFVNSPLRTTYFEAILGTGQAAQFDIPKWLTPDSKIKTTGHFNPALAIGVVMMAAQMMTMLTQEQQPAQSHH